ncbi:MAG: hypothetical protein ACM3O8_04675 [Methylococcaceae bacterium]|nr:hypothetical protein [Prolixibacteraceae bacterium]
MRQLRLKSWSKAAAFVAVGMVFISSCKKDDPVLPDYAGTWVTVETVASNGKYVQVKDIRTFTQTSFTELVQKQLTSDTWTDYASVKGTLSVYGDVMNVTVTEMGASSYSMVTNLPTGVISYYKKGTSEFDVLIAQMDQPKTFESKFSVSGNKMIIQTDLNSDGDYLDEMETSVYTKQ